MFECSIKYIIGNREETQLTLTKGSSFNLGNNSKDKFIIQDISSNKVDLVLTKENNSILVASTNNFELEIGDKIQLKRFDGSIDPVIDIPITLEITNISNIQSFRL